VIESVDVLVVGAGPTGLACGIELQRRGVKAVLIEKGCVVNSIYRYPTHMTFFTTPELLEIGDIPMTSLNEKPNRAEALKYYRRVSEHYRLDIRQYEREDYRRRQRVPGLHHGPFAIEPYVPRPKDRAGHGVL
jgi:thioredoxin reductase (NADPH)